MHLARFLPYAGNSDYFSFIRSCFFCLFGCPALCLNDDFLSVTVQLPRDELDVPVFPEEGSMIVSPGFRIPALSASSTIRTAILSFKLPPALKKSHLATASRKTYENTVTLSRFRID